MHKDIEALTLTLPSLRLLDFSGFISNFEFLLLPCHVPCYFIPWPAPIDYSSQIATFLRQHPGLVEFSVEIKSPLVCENEIENESIEMR
jgi:hypothetical protein